MGFPLLVGKPYLGIETEDGFGSDLKSGFLNYFLYIRLFVYDPVC